MKNALFALLVAIPTALITWIVARGAYERPLGECQAAAKTTNVAPTNEVTAKAEPEVESDPDERLSDFVEKPLEGFTITDEVVLYGRSGLFEYINGGAPLYIDRNFRKLVAAEMKSNGGGDLTCDIYDMRTPSDAKSIFDAENSTNVTTANFGDAARTGSLSLVFRKGQYYVKLTAYDTKAEATLPNLARVLLTRME
ncbi:MAG: hypothetical protein A2289_19580 [Deltaproteobacteria bacterium RIFOXYA12_FULL_58_15]|nr:MAG: hypothetical protein A2289_19580 [Deltaproteobacteria bacterium RIFOXYA12_FULL_58_15]OGR09279.1 MAG: hypothetical protein A2341_24340 [Deltaproteobacteria bacterium RIFOXYB12_FULL_58_9]